MWTDGYYRIEDALARRGNAMPVLTGKYSYNCLTGRIVLVDRDNVYQATLKKEKSV